MDLQLTPAARAQFLAAVNSIRRHNAAAARRFLQRAGQALKRIARLPNSGALVAEFPELPYREVFVKPYRFFYRVEEKTVWVVAVWHGAQVPDDPGPE